MEEAPEAPQCRDLETTTAIGGIWKMDIWDGGRQERPLGHSSGGWHCAPSLPRPPPGAVWLGRPTSWQALVNEDRGAPSTCPALSAPDCGSVMDTAVGAAPPCTSPPLCLPMTRGVLLPLYQASPSPSLPPYSLPHLPPPSGSRVS